MVNNYFTHSPASISFIIHTQTHCGGPVTVRQPYRAVMRRKISEWIANNERVFWGWFFLLFGFIFFVGFSYAAILSKLLPPSNNHFLSAIQQDRYYCLLVPLTLPIVVVAVYFHWLSMKMFKHA